MDDPRDFLPARYRDIARKNNFLRKPWRIFSNDTISTFKTNLQSTLTDIKKTNVPVTGVIAALFLVVGVFASYTLMQENQDTRQQASVNDSNDPYAPSVLVTSTPRPETEAACGGSGKWFNDVCYVYWETLPGGTHVVVPPATIGNYSYATFVPITTANQYLAANSATVDQEVIPTVTPTLVSSLVTSVPNRPETEAACSGSGKWFNDVCYVYWEVLPGGTHVVVPPATIGNYSYAVFAPVTEVQTYLAENDLEIAQVTETVTPVISPTTSVTPAILPTVSVIPTNLGKIPSKTNTYYNQLDPRWSNIPIEGRTFGNVGCGVVSVANIVGQLPTEVLKLYAIGSSTGITEHGTSLAANVSALEKLGYRTSTGVNGTGALEAEVRNANIYNDYAAVLEGLENYQNNGWQIMIGGNFGNVGGHWAVLEDVDVATGTISVIDPNGGESEKYVLDVSGSLGNDVAVTPTQLILAKKI
jgi:hypothetical protein